MGNTHSQTDQHKQRSPAVVRSAPGTHGASSPASPSPNPPHHSKEILAQASPSPPESPLRRRNASLNDLEDEKQRGDPLQHPPTMESLHRLGHRQQQQQLQPSGEDPPKSLATKRLRGMTGSSIDSLLGSPTLVEETGIEPPQQFKERDIEMGVSELRLKVESASGSTSPTSPQELRAPVDVVGSKRGSVASDMASEVNETGLDAKTTIPVYFTWTNGGEKVFVTGTFTGWRRKIPLVKKQNDFSLVLHLPPGTHRFRFLVDNEWRTSDDLAQATDSAGNLVNYIEISSVNLPALERSDRHGDLSEHIKPKTEVYVRKIPSYLIDAVERESPHPAPPTLPPHLEKVILNANNTMKDDSSVLPNPNHVVLNHLSASSIRNNVLAVSATTRYRKKYVSTVLYKALDVN